MQRYIINFDYLNSKIFDPILQNIFALVQSLIFPLVHNFLVTSYLVTQLTSKGNQPSYPIPLLLFIDLFSVTDKDRSLFYTIMNYKNNIKQFHRPNEDLTATCIFQNQIANLAIVNGIHKRSYSYVLMLEIVNIRKEIDYKTKTNNIFDTRRILM